MCVCVCVCVGGMCIIMCMCVDKCAGPSTREKKNGLIAGVLGGLDAFFSRALLGSGVVCDLVSLTIAYDYDDACA